MENNDGDHKYFCSWLMKDWVQSQVNTGVYANTSDYIRDLIRQDQQNRSKLAALQAAITTGIESGVSDKSFDQIIDQVRHELKNTRSWAGMCFLNRLKMTWWTSRYGFLNYGENKADLYINTLKDKCWFLSCNPSLYRERHEFNPPVRICHHQKHRIIYTIETDYILIARICHERMDIPRYLDD